MLPAAQRNEMKEMRSSVTSTVVLVGLTAGLASIYGCSVSAEDPQNPFVPGGGTSTGTSGSGTGGSTATTAGSGGSTGVAGSVGMSGSATGGSAPVAGTGAGGMSGAGGGGGGSGGASSNDITKVWKSDGFGKAYAGPSGILTLATMGMKAADCAAHLKNGTKVCGPWTLDRKFNLILPTPYDPNKSYPMLFEGPGCGGGADSLYNGFSAAFTNSIIRVGLQPSRIEAHGTNPGEGCFDDKEGDDSMDWVLYEMLYDKFNADLSFDRNRVFAGGNSSGAWFSNELGCKYAGDAKRPVRGIMPNTGGLPTEAPYVPTCTQAGMAGFWSHEINDGTNPFSGNIVAIDRAMKVNKCAQQNYATAQFDPFPLTGGSATACKRIKNCDPMYPLVVCALPGDQHGSHTEIVHPGWPTFMGLFNVAPLLTP
jgi:hypothetical protein